MFSLDLDFTKSLNLIVALCKLGRFDKAAVQLQFHLNSMEAVAKDIGNPLSETALLDEILEIEDFLLGHGIRGLVASHFDSAVPVTSQ
jgi:hypothetical protein